MFEQIAWTGLLVFLIGTYIMVLVGMVAALIELWRDPNLHRFEKFGLSWFLLFAFFIFAMIPFGVASNN